ncbi:MAG TPA: DMT family transporter [Desulfobacteraceae bacterium]|nr:DMT family transporter [Deltaproteobacteria bacterium]MBW2357095.1 DMT family transporter [Deltaproteobacteria bacterium]HDI59661.1 DMT family transporter [Desulfobacteraceae bacterium]
MESRALRADLLLLATAAIWGFAFVAQRMGMDHVGPFTFNGVRFALGSLSLLPLVWLEARRPAVGGTARPGGKSVFYGGALAGSALFLGASLQQVGLVYTTAGKAGFITGLYVVIVPILGLCYRQRPDAGTWIGAVMAAAGLYLLSVTEQFTIAPGDLLELVGAFFWACHLLILGWLSPRLPVICLACLQYACCALLSLAVALACETVALAAIRAAALPILYGGLGSVGIAYTLQVVAQKDAPPAHAAILLSLEAVFAALGGWLILGEVLSPRAMAGCALMLAAMLISQLYATIVGRRRPPAQVHTVLPNVEESANG